MVGTQKTIRCASFEYLSLTFDFLLFLPYAIYAGRNISNETINQVSHAHSSQRHPRRLFPVRNWSHGPSLRNLHQSRRRSLHLDLPHDRSIKTLFNRQKLLTENSKTNQMLHHHQTSLSQQQRHQEKVAVRLPQVLGNLLQRHPAIKLGAQVDPD